MNNEKTLNCLYREIVNAYCLFFKVILLTFLYLYRFFAYDLRVIPLFSIDSINFWKLPFYKWCEIRTVEKNQIWLKFN